MQNHKSANRGAKFQELSQELSQDKQSSGIAVMARFYWMILGNFMLLGVAAAIFNFPKFPGLLELVYFVIAGSIILVRYLDIALLDGLTAEGMPATVGDWKRYAVRIGIIALAVWALSHLPAVLSRL